MIDIDAVASQVKHNCNISDAKFWGFYSPCGLLLRLRDLYRFEHNMQPWDPIKNDLIKQWIDEREGLWYELEGLEFQDIRVNGSIHQPFDVENINAVLSKYGYMYSAGYGNSLKPVFILAERSAGEKMKNYNVYIAGRELSRDLSTSPAMAQGNTIIARRDTMSLIYWNKFEEMKSMKCSGLLHDAFSGHGISRDSEKEIPFAVLQKRFAQLVNDEISTYIHHELGESSQRRVLGRWWKELLLKLPHSRAEFFVRSLKDVLSDTCKAGTLSYMIRNRTAGSLAFYVALLGGFRRIIFPGMITAYARFRESNEWAIIEKARAEGYKQVKSCVVKLRALYDADRATADVIDRELIP